MKLICTKCDGLGNIRVPIERMDPGHNVAQYDTQIYEDGCRCPRGLFPPWNPVNGGVTAYERFCTCRQGFVEWDRGRSLVPSIHALEATEKQS